MAESGATRTYTDLKSEVAHYLGYGYGTSQLNDTQSNQCDRLVQEGYEQFLTPEVMQPNGSMGIHQWSWLSPVASIAITSSTVDYDLPDDFAGFVGHLTISSTTSIYAPISVIGEAQIRAMRAASDVTSTPRYAAVRVKDGFDGASTSTRWELMIWPTPDAAYTVEGRYNVLFEPLSVSAPYPLGGARYSLLLLQSCLAAAERRSTDDEGVHTRTFMRRLQSAVALDRLQSAPQYLGYNGDHSDGAGTEYDRTQYVTYDGVLY